MKTIAAARFKAQCLALLDKVDPEGIVITKHGKPVARLVLVETDSASLLGKLQGRIRIRGQVLSTGLRWDGEYWHPQPPPRPDGRPDPPRISAPGEWGL